MRDPAPNITGLAVTDEGHVLVGTSIGTITFGLTPAEMRSLAARLTEAADAMETDAAEAASAAIARAGGLQ